MTNDNYYRILSINNFLFIVVFFKGSNYCNISGPAIRLRRMLSHVLSDIFIVNNTHHIIITIYAWRLKRGKKIRNRSVNANNASRGLNDGILNHLNPPSDVFCMWRARSVLTRRGEQNVNRRLKSADIRW